MAKNPKLTKITDIFQKKNRTTGQGKELALLPSELSELPEPQKLTVDASTQTDPGVFLFFLKKPKTL